MFAKIRLKIFYPSVFYPELQRLNYPNLKHSRYFDESEIWLLVS
jgi:hypothetical protein